jgi:hypothetical protein
VCEVGLMQFGEIRKFACEMCEIVMYCPCKLLLLAIVPVSRVCVVVPVAHHQCVSARVGGHKIVDFVNGCASLLDGIGGVNVHVDELEMSKRSFKM